VSLCQLVAVTARVCRKELLVLAGLAGRAPARAVEILSGRNVDRCYFGRSNGASLHLLSACVEMSELAVNCANRESAYRAPVKGRRSMRLSTSRTLLWHCSKQASSAREGRI
jgi:hypothetical protein